VHHAKWYRTASTYALPRYAARQIVVVGNGNSANDAAAHLAQTTTKERPVLRSVIEAARPVFVSLPDERIRDVPAVKRYVLKEEGGEQTLDLELVDGTVIANTVVLLGVGYVLSPLRSSFVSRD
jgi:thioredoxin reductase